MLPVRLKPEDWSLGETYWLPDIVAPDARSPGALIVRLNHVASHGRFKLHPAILRLIDNETLQNSRRGRPGVATNAVAEGVCSHG